MRNTAIKDREMERERNYGIEVNRLGALIHGNEGN